MSITDRAMSALEDYNKMDLKLRPPYMDYMRERVPEWVAQMEEEEREKRAQIEINRTWEPTEEFIQQYMKNQGWPTFDAFTFDHLETKAEVDCLKAAIDTTKEFSKLVQGGNGASMIVLASAIDGDLERTGYGCGKTTLARCVHYKNGTMRWVRDIGQESAQMSQNGSFYEARQLMAIFDKDDYNPHYGFGFIGNLLVVDDVGREGSLKWERRDPESQLQEKQGRYYNVINYCYEKGISVLITSNFASRELAAFLGGATWSRLLQMCPKKFRINLTGIRDMRPLLAETDWF